MGQLAAVSGTRERLNQALVNILNSPETEQPADNVVAHTSDNLMVKIAGQRRIVTVETQVDQPANVSIVVSLAHQPFSTRKTL